MRQNFIETMSIRVGNKSRLKKKINVFDLNRDWFFKIHFFLFFFICLMPMTLELKHIVLMIEITVHMGTQHNDKN